MINLIVTGSCGRVFIPGIIYKERERFDESAHHWDRPILCIGCNVMQHNDKFDISGIYCNICIEENMHGCADKLLT